MKVQEVKYIADYTISIKFDDGVSGTIQLDDLVTKGIFDIEKNELIGGELPPRVLGIVTEWTAIHQDELLVNW